MNDDHDQNFSRTKINIYSFNCAAATILLILATFGGLIEMLLMSTDPFKSSAELADLVRAAQSDCPNQIIAISQIQGTCPQPKWEDRVYNAGTKCFYDASHMNYNNDFLCPGEWDRTLCWSPACEEGPKTFDCPIIQYADKNASVTNVITRICTSCGWYDKWDEYDEIRYWEEQQRCIKPHEPELKVSLKYRIIDNTNACDKEVENLLNLQENHDKLCVKGIEKWAELWYLTEPGKNIEYSRMAKYFICQIINKLCASPMFSDKEKKIYQNLVLDLLSSDNRTIHYSKFWYCETGFSILGREYMKDHPFEYLSRSFFDYTRLMFGYSNITGEMFQKFYYDLEFDNESLYKDYLYFALKDGYIDHIIPDEFKFDYGAIDPGKIHKEFLYYNDDDLHYQDYEDHFEFYESYHELDPKLEAYLRNISHLCVLHPFQEEAREVITEITGS